MLENEYWSAPGSFEKALQIRLLNELDYHRFRLSD
jgi:hypothetical protein